MSFGLYRKQNRTHSEGKNLQAKDPKQKAEETTPCDMGRIPNFNMA